MVSLLYPWQNLLYPYCFLPYQTPSRTKRKETLLLNRTIVALDLFKAFDTVLHAPAFKGHIATSEIPTTSRK